MHSTVEQLLKKLGVEQTLEPYETIPFDYFNDEKGTDFTAGVAMSGDARFIDAEIQMIEEKESQELPDLKQVFLMRSTKQSDGGYSCDYMKVLDKVVSGDEKNWFENGCRFFKLCTSHIKKGMIPDFDVLYKAAFGSKKDGDGNMGGSGSRNFKNDKPPPKPPKPPGKL